MQRSSLIVTTAALMLVVYTSALFVVGQVASSLQTNTTIPTTGTIKTVGVGVYWDLDCTNPVGSINWATIEPGAIKDRIVYIKNEGNSASTLSMSTSNWNPSNAQDHMTLSWDYDGQSINVNEVIQVKLTLSVSAAVEGITSFSFDITISGSG